MATLMETALDVPSDSNDSPGEISMSSRMVLES